MTQETTTTQNMPAINLTNESSVAGWEWTLIGTVVLIAGIYLLRKLGGRRGGCGSCGKANACVVGCHALALIEPHADRPGRITLGADKGYDTEDFVNELRSLNVTPHVEAEAKGSTIDSALRVTPDMR